MIVFEKIRWKNMLSTGNVFTEVVLNKFQNTLIVGPNGHGKSTMLDAITFALFGKPFRKINKPMLVNSINLKDCLVELEFSIGGRKHFIRRGINPNIFEIRINGSLVNQEAVSKDYQKYLEQNVLKFNYRAFTQIVILGSKSFTPFMKLIPQDRRTIIENLLDIQIFSSMNSVAKADLVKAKSEIIDNKKSIESVQEKIELQKRYVEESRKNTAGEIEKRETAIDTHLRALGNLNQQQKDLKDKMVVLLDTVSDLSSVEDKLSQLRGFEVKIESNRNKARKDFKFYDENDNCPTCKQGIEEEFKTAAISRANSSIAQFDTALGQLSGQQDKLNTRLSEIQVTMKQHQQLTIEFNKNKVNVFHIEQHVKVLEDEITKLKEQKVLSDDMMDVSKKLLTDLEYHHGKHRELVENRAYLELAVEFLKDGGIKAQIIKQYLPVINQLVNKYLSAMDFFVNFELNEQFIESIKSRHRDTFTYDSFSEGEKQKIDIALLFAWRAVAKMKNSLNCNLLILDEIFDSSLDGVGADLVLAILSAMPHEANVFVISHRELLHDRFQNTIRYEKRNNFSEIIDGDE